MSTESNEETVDKKNPENPENIEVRMVPEGTFAGTIEKPMLVKDGEPVPENTGDEGGGQN
jgi:hypothetical protein